MTRTTAPLTITVPGLGEVTYPRGAAVPERHLPHVAKHQRSLLKTERAAPEQAAPTEKPTKKATPAKVEKTNS